MSCILYYSNYCDKCKNILRLVGKSELKDDIHFICIDKRFRNPQNGGTYVILENQQKMWDSYQKIDQPKNLNIKLFPHQLVSVYYMEMIEKYINKATKLGGFHALNKKDDE